MDFNDVFYLSHLLIKIKNGFTTMIRVNKLYRKENLQKIG